MAHEEATQSVASRHHANGRGVVDGAAERASRRLPGGLGYRACASGVHANAERSADRAPAPPPLFVNHSSRVAPSRGPGARRGFGRGIAGFTLLEVALGLMVMSVVFAGVLTAAVRIRHLAVVSQATARANTLVNSTVEELRSLSYDRLVEHLQGKANRSGRIDAASVAGVYPLNWDIEPDQQNADYLRVRVTVSWAVQGQPGALTVITDFYRHGINQR